MKLPDEAVRARQRAGQGLPDCCKAERQTRLPVPGLTAHRSKARTNRDRFESTFLSKEGFLFGFFFVCLFGF